MGEEVWLREEEEGPFDVSQGCLYSMHKKVRGVTAQRWFAQEMQLQNRLHGEAGVRFFMT